MTDTVAMKEHEAALKELAKLSADNKVLQGQVTAASEAVKVTEEKLRIAMNPAVPSTTFTVPNVNFLDALQQQTNSAMELQPTDNYRQVADKTFKAHKLAPLTSTQWMAASSSVFLQPFAYPKVLAEGDPVVAAGFIVSGLRAEFSTISPDLCADLCGVVMGMAATVIDYVASKKTPQAQMELLMATLISCQRKIEMLQDRRANRGFRGGRGGYRGGRGGGGRGGAGQFRRQEKRYHNRADEEPEAEAETGGRGADRARGRGRVRRIR